MLNRELKQVIAGVSMATLIVIAIFVTLAVVLTARYDIGTQPAHANEGEHTPTPTPTPYYAPTPYDKTTRTIKYNGTEVTGAMAIVFDSNKTTWENYSFSRYSPVDHDTYYQWNGSQMVPTGTPVDSSWTETWSPSAPPASPASVSLTATWLDNDTPPGGNDTPTPPGALGPTTAGAPFAIALVNVAGITAQVTQGSGSWVGNTFHVSVGSTVQFQANRDPGGTTWPTGKPAWGGAASGTGSTASVTFSSAGNTTVTCECGNTAKLGVAVVGVGGIQWSETGNDPWTNVSATTQYVPVGATRYFKAVSDPTGATWPSGKPAWSGSSGVTGTGETKSVTFGAVSSNPTDYKTVVAECGTTAGVSVVVVGLSALQWRATSNDPWTTITSTIYIPLGAARYFKALPNPAGATWPTDKPAWGGSSCASGTGETVSVTFDTTSTSAADYKTLVAECGNDVTANAVVVAVDKIEVQESGSWVDRTGQTIYVDVGTTVSFRAQPAPTGATWPSDCPVWSGDASGTTGTEVTIVFNSTGEKHVTAGPGEKTVTVEVIEVRIEKCSASFLPKGGSEDNTTTLRAYVTPNTVKGRFNFTLFDVSDEPGYCLNAPQNVPSSGEDSDSWKDLQFPSQSGFSITGSNNDNAETSASNVSEATVSIKSYDYGSYGKIRAQFTPQNTTLPFNAREDGGTSLSTLIPADINYNHIADSWSGNTGPTTSSLATDDTDNNPILGRYDGDGLSRYQEYRGFMIKGVHTRTNPGQKDLFVFDEDNITLGDFGTVGVFVHLIDNTEWSGTGVSTDKRIINRYVGSDGLSFIQHGLHLRNYDLTGGYHDWGVATGSNEGPPRESPEIRVDVTQITQDQAVDNPTRSSDDRAGEVINTIIAHELSHGIFVTHHNPTGGGESNCIMRYFFDAINLYKKSANDDALSWSTMTIPVDMCNSSPDNCRSEVQVTDR